MSGAPYDIPEDRTAGPGEGGARRQPSRARAPRFLLAYVLAAVALAVGAATVALSIVSRGRLAGKAASLAASASSAARRIEELEEVLAREKGLRETAEVASKRYEGLVASLRESRQEKGAMYLTAERERREMSRISEEKSDELIQRHNRIVELQNQVERLMRERSDNAESAFDRETELRRVYEAEIRNERHRRSELEERLAVLEEIRELRRRLARLADKMEELVREEAAQRAREPREAR